jgi:hypothetical protein
MCERMSVMKEQRQTGKSKSSVKKEKGSKTKYIALTKHHEHWPPAAGR